MTFHNIRHSFVVFLGSIYFKIDLVDVDDTDKKILLAIQNNPGITHSEISTKVKLSQPAVGARIKKLKEKNILELNYGLIIREIGLKISRVDISSKAPTSFLKKMSKKKNVINAYRMVGKIYLVLWVAGKTMSEVEDGINQIIKLDKDRSEIVKVSMISSFEKKFFLPIE
ncbi:MAG: Lrp/AsnC family transcriptional regulator [Promethearchaeia archaeon]